MPIESIRQLVTTDMDAVNAIIQARLASDVPLINQISHYIIHGGGKRLRPILVLLSAKAFDYRGEAHLELAAIIEFIHTATLLHDDVVDESNLRRGQRTSNAVWGNAASVLVGDFVYSRTFQMMARLQNMDVMALMADTTNTIAEGEVLQLLNCKNPDITEDAYMQVIHRKTGILFQAAAELGAVLCQRSTAERQAMAAYGLHLGTAFQLIDDALDYTAQSSELLGKNLGDDLAEGKPTLPLIYALMQATNEQQQLIRQAITQGNTENLAEIQTAIASTGAIAYTYEMAKQQANAAIGALNNVPNSVYRDACIELAHFAVQRQY